MVGVPTVTDDGFPGDEGSSVPAFVGGFDETRASVAGDGPLSIEVCFCALEEGVVTVGFAGGVDTIVATGFSPAFRFLIDPLNSFLLSGLGPVTALLALPVLMVVPTTS